MLKPGIDSKRLTLIGLLLVSLGRSIVDGTYRSIGQVRLCDDPAMKSTEVVVICCGCIGLASAIALAAREANVILVERGLPGQIANTPRGNRQARLVVRPGANLSKALTRDAGGLRDTQRRIKVATGGPLLLLVPYRW
jgi:hypothetical protein